MPDSVAFWRSASTDSVYVGTDTTRWFSVQAFNGDGGRFVPPPPPWYSAALHWCAIHPWPLLALASTLAFMLLCFRRDEEVDYDA